MQLVVAGALADSRSGVVHRRTLPNETCSLWSLAELPPTIERPTTVPAHDIGLSSGQARFMLVNVTDASINREMHRADAISFTVVVQGSIDLILEAETVRLEPTDFLIVLGVMHGWQAISDSVLLATTVIGLAS